MDKSNADKKDKIESIFYLHRSIISLYFKDFEDVYTLPEGLNFTHMRAAMIIRFQGHITMSELSKELVLEKGSFTPVAATLIKKGIVKKEQSLVDRRVYNLVLTEKGERLTLDFRNDHWDFIESGFECLDIDEQNEYYKFVNGLNYYNKKMEREKSKTSLVP
ncbi:MAG: MarR family transcriptional regulator [Spirochaetales bacterium]|nr:MarR family transcriptional regulator [Spirochaetales bacterium]